MGNKLTKSRNSKHEQAVLNMYQQLINIGFDDNTSMLAAHKYAKNLNKAIDFIQKSNLNQGTKDDNNNNDGKRININDNTHETQKAVYEKLDDEPLDNCCIGNCISLNRLIIILKFYKNHNDINDENDIDKLSKYLILNREYLLNDYHHILNVHLNED
eukprot:147772_1